MDRQEVHELVRRFLPETRRRGLRAELGFWRSYLQSKGLDWPDDYRLRLKSGTPLQEPLFSWADRLAGDRVRILDVGSGPLTKVGKAHPSKRVVLTPIDILAREYSRLIKEFGVSPPVPTIFGDAQKLREQFGESKFDIVHAENSLDHVCDPVEALGEMIAVTRAGGVVILVHAQNEGRTQNYEDLHKWDFSCEDGEFIMGGPGPRGSRWNVTSLFSNQAAVRCTIRDDGCVLVEMNKHFES